MNLYKVTWEIAEDKPPVAERIEKDALPPGFFEMIDNKGSYSLYKNYVGVIYINIDFNWKIATLHFQEMLDVANKLHKELTRNKTIDNILN